MWFTGREKLKGITELCEKSYTVSSILKAQTSLGDNRTFKELKKWFQELKRWAVFAKFYKFKRNASDDKRKKMNNSENGPSLHSKKWKKIFMMRFIQEWKKSDTLQHTIWLEVDG